MKCSGFRRRRETGEGHDLGRVLRSLLLLLLLALMVASGGEDASAQDGGAEQGDRQPRLAYLVSDLRIPFWDIMWRGAQSEAAALGYDITVYSAENSARAELMHLILALRRPVDGIILSPTTSLAAATILDLANQAAIPVVIADIGTDQGDFVSYISSDNEMGAYDLGRVLAGALEARGWQDGSVGVVAIPQKRANGQARTRGFSRAMAEAGIRMAGIKQQVDFSYQETFNHTAALLAGDPLLRAVWLQGSDRYQGALDAVEAAGRSGDVLLLTFDAETEFLDMIPQGKLLAAGMQQPFLIGEKAVAAMHGHLQGLAVPKEQQLPVLTVSSSSLDDLLPVIRRNVLGLQSADRQGNQ